jgi:hypothetical protein
MRIFFGIVIFVGMILSAVYGAGDLFILIMGGIFILLGVITIIRYLKTGEMIENLRFVERLRGRSSALFLGGFIFILFVIFYATFLFNYIATH